MSSEVMDIAALGRPFTLGMLYDARRDELIPGLTLWDEKTLKEKTVETSKPWSDFYHSVSDSIESKSSLMDIEASLKASFMSRLIEVDGSAKYLNDTKKFKNQSRVTCRYKATTHFNQLSMTQLGTMTTEQVDVIKKGLATHVVTGILYGADAFFVFDSEKLEASSVQDMQGNMEAVIKKIPSFNVEGQVDIKLTAEEKELTNKFSCKFYGDFFLQSNPATFEDAVKTYVDLPELLREDGGKTVPVKVWMMPLKDFDTTAAELKREISAGLVERVQNVLEDLREIQMRCNDSLDDTVVQKFPQIQEELMKFQNFYNRYVSNLQMTMAKKLPSIREGKEDESSVEKLLDDRKKSQFSHKKLDEWLKHKEREINIIRSCVDMMEGTKIVHNQSELDREVLAVDEALCFVFTSLQSADPVLDEMDKYLDPPKGSTNSLKESTNEDLDPPKESTNEVPWYYSDEVLTKMREKAKSFQDIAKSLQSNRRFCFLVAAITNEKYTGATIYYYRNGILLTEDFSKPDIRDVETVTDRRDLIWYACDLTLDPNTANGFLRLSEDNKKATCDSWLYYPDHPDRFDSLTQVLCKEGLTGRHYWEVELGYGSWYNSVYIVAAYKRVARKGRGYNAELGYNSISWAFGKNGGKFRSWHINQLWAGPVPPKGVSKVGVFLDHEGGTLSFYRVSSNTLEHLYTFKSCFTEPLYPGLWAYWTGNYARICPFD